MTKSTSRPAVVRSMSTSKTLLAAALLGLAGMATAAEPAPDFTVVGSAGLYSDYRFRGISQTDKKPAFQGGFTVNHSSGFYVGNWNSNIDTSFYTPPGSASGSNLEVDLFAGYATEVSGVGLDFGLLQYYYPNSSNFYDTLEAYAGAKYGPLSAKLSYALTDYFGVADSEGTMYLTLGLSHSFTDTIAVSATANSTLGEGGVVDYEDYVLGVSYALPQGFTVGLNYHITNGQGSKVTSVSGKDLGDDGAVIYISKSF